MDLRNKQKIESLRPKLLDLSRNPLISTKLCAHSNSHSLRDLKQEAPGWTIAQHNIMIQRSAFGGNFSMQSSSGLLCLAEGQQRLAWTYQLVGERVVGIGKYPADPREYQPLCGNERTKNNDQRDEIPGPRYSILYATLLGFDDAIGACPRSISSNRRGDRMNWCARVRPYVAEHAVMCQRALRRPTPRGTRAVPATATAVGLAYPGAEQSTAVEAG